MDGRQAPPPDEEVCSYCGWIPYAIAAIPVVVPFLLLLLHQPILLLVGLYIRSQNGDKRELLLKTSTEEAYRDTRPSKTLPKPTSIVGFFHPYWYLPHSLSSHLPLKTKEANEDTVMPVAVVNGSSGPQFMPTSSITLKSSM